MVVDADGLLDVQAELLAPGAAQHQQQQQQGRRDVLKRPIVVLGRPHAERLRRFLDR